MLALSRRALVVAAIAATSACTIHDSNPPPLTGPSGLALTLTVTASPDTINQDGGSQSAIRVTAVGPEGRGVASLPIRMDMLVNGVAQDFGTLSARTIVTGTDGAASVVFTAPPRPTNGIFGTCNGLAGNCVSIVATASGTNFVTANPASVDIRLVPPGIILPPASNPTAAFTISPTPVNFNIPATFDASTSCGSQLTSGICPNTSAITNYVWNFGDGETAAGVTVAHTFVGPTPATSFNVVLTVTNDRGLSASATQVVSVNRSELATGDWTFSPRSVAPGDVVFFNAEGVRPPAGHVLISYNWNFGDGTTGFGVQTTHVFTVANTYAVVLTVTDDVGQRTVKPQNVPIGAGANASFTSSVSDAATHTMAFDATASTGSAGASIASYQWDFGDGTSFGPSTSPTASHTYLNAGTYRVTLTVVDTTLRTGTNASSVIVP